MTYKEVCFSVVVIGIALFFVGIYLVFINPFLVSGKEILVSYYLTDRIGQIGILAGGLTWLFGNLFMKHADVGKDTKKLKI